MTRLRLLSVFAASTMFVVLTGCAASAPPAVTAPTGASGSIGETRTTASGDGVDGGGAAEVAEPASALVVADSRGGLALIDLETEEHSVIAEPGAPALAVDGTGRFVLITRETDSKGTDAATTVDIVDTGRWTQPHGDHSHYFHGDVRLLGEIIGAGAVSIGVGADAAAIVFADQGELVTLPFEGLGATGIDAATRTDAPHGIAVPLDGRIVIAGADAVSVDGTDTVVACSSTGDVDTTRVGAVFACTDGAVLAHREVGGDIALEPIPYPAGSAAASELSGRSDRPDLAGVAGEQGAWLLDVRARTWTLLASDRPLLRAVAVGDDDSRTVVLDADGRVRILSDDGSVLARTELLGAEALSDPSLRERVQLHVTGAHAYLSDPSTGVVHEIGLADAVVTRTFTELQPWAIALVG